ncbi:hypothetical protein [Mucilaginibacter sp. dw_454]|uniref:hypothetical protein n=1 Tax=Mucilaginibacter sp. dw_454 TaxID=2720079 RepID=UPI001BD4F5A2|nr:hypothetical protein [Mucilaginibacter sp. dw_454]
MKKLPLVFCCLFFACSSEKEVINNQVVFSRHPQPFHVSTVGEWHTGYKIYTLTDANDIYFTVKVNVVRALKRGDVYVP